jgi:hypothetical protein
MEKKPYVRLLGLQISIKADMSTVEKGRPIFDRLRLTSGKKPGVQAKESPDIQAEEIRKAWMERAHPRPAK